MGIYVLVYGGRWLNEENERGLAAIEGLEVIEKTDCRVIVRAEKTDVPMIRQAMVGWKIKERQMKNG